MLSIHWGFLEGVCVFYPTDGISIIFYAFLNFILHFLPSENTLGDICQIYLIFLTKLHVV